MNNTMHLFNSFKYKRRSFCLMMSAVSLAFFHQHIRALQAFLEIMKLNQYHTPGFPTFLGNSESE